MLEPVMEEPISVEETVETVETSSEVAEELVVSASAELLRLELAASVLEDFSLVVVFELEELELELVEVIGSDSVACWVEELALDTDNVKSGF